MNGAQLLVKSLAAEGVTIVFGYPGGAIMPFYDALLDAPFRHILVRHEQAAALAADGYARATGKVGVCVATSGPGATNLMTGLANANLDSVPMVAITGQVPTEVLGTDAFQEVDVLGMSLPLVKHSFLVRRASDLAAVVSEAFRLAKSGRPGPVLIDVPKDVCLADVQAATPEIAGQPDRTRLDDAAIRRARAAIQKAKKPLIYAGGGIAISGRVDVFRDFVAKMQIPVVATLKGLGSLPVSHPLFLGMLGMHGLKAANVAVQACDLLLAVGARFDDRATGKLATFAPNANVIHLDIDPGEIGKLRRANVALAGDLRRYLPKLVTATDIAEWRDQCLESKAETSWEYNPPVEGIYAPRLLRDLSLAVPENTVVTCDVGQHQMWVAQHYRIQSPDRHLSSGGLGTMGYGLPAAIGAQLGNPEAAVIAVCGDGSFLMNVQELATVSRYNLPIKILLLDNQCLGLVRQWQELFFKKRFSAVDLSDNPDFVALAKAFRIPGFTVTQASQEVEVIRAMVEEPGPLLVHVQIDPKENVWPLVPPGRANHQMLQEVRS